MKKRCKRKYVLLTSALYLSIGIIACMNIACNSHKESHAIKSKVDSIFANSKLEGLDIWKANDIYRVPSTDSICIDLTQFRDCEFSELPDMIPTFIDDKYSVDVFNISQSSPLFSCLFASYQGISYRLGLLLYQFFHPMGGGKAKNIITYDPHFTCFGYRIGDQIPESLQKLSRVMNDIPIPTDTQNSWRMKVSNDTIIGFYRSGLEEMVIDSVMESNYYKPLHKTSY